MNRLRRIWGQIWIAIRYPNRQSGAWINVGAWTVAIATVVLCIILDLMTGQWGWLLWQCVVGAFDFVMLHRALQGLLWRISLDKWLQERIKQG